MSKWAVLVVHGVGDTGPGVTVDNLLWSLKENNPNLRPDGVRHEFWLQETPAELSQLAPAATRECHTQATTTDLFPVNVRCAKVEAPVAPAEGQLPRKQPGEAVFAEVYWADLSRVREGTLDLLYSLISAIFFLRFIPDWAAFLNGRWSRWLRFLLNLAAWWLCSPIAALTALLAYMLAVQYWVLSPLYSWLVSRPPGPPGADLGSWGERVGLSGLGGVTFFAVLWVTQRCRRRNWGSTWTRFWSAFAVWTVLLTLAVAFLPPDIWDLFVAAGKDRLGLKDMASISYPVQVFLILLFTLQAAFCLLGGFLILLVLPVWLIAWLSRSGGQGAQPALGAALGAALVQIGLWVISIPPLVAIASRTLLPEEARDDTEKLLLPTVWESFALHMLQLLFFALAVLIVLRWRHRWLRLNPGPFQFPPLGRDIPRLVVHVLIIVFVVLLALSGSGLFLLKVASGYTPIGADLPAAITSLVVASITIGGAVLKSELRDWLHVVLDVINHFYRRWEKVPLPWEPLPVVDVHEFETQQLIERRFRKVLDFLLADPDVTHLSVVSHSQGTIIAVDVLAQGALCPAEKANLRRRLGALAEFHLITMGSPLTHLYQHYFPMRYPSLRDPSWGDLQSAVPRWLNIYRVDDFIGTYVETDVPGWAGSPMNIPIAAGGHTGYWREKEVLKLLQDHAALPG